MALTDKLTAIADAVREKTGRTAPLTLDQMAAEVTGIKTVSDGYECIRLIDIPVKITVTTDITVEDSTV